MSSKEQLSIEFCSYAAAMYAVMNWHYSKRMPLSKMVRFGVWEDGIFVGAILFSQGGSPFLGQRYGPSREEVCELTRVAVC